MNNNKAKIKKIANNIVLVTQNFDDYILFSLHRIIMKNNEKTASTVKFLTINTGDFTFKTNNHAFFAMKKDEIIIIKHSYNYINDNTEKTMVNYYNIAGDIVSIEIE